LAANERVLWLAVVSESRSVLLAREAGGSFDLHSSIERRVATTTALDRELLVFFDDGTTYRYSPDEARSAVERILPGKTVPLDMVGERGIVYAIIPAATARELPPTPAEGEEPTSQPFEPGEAPLCLAIYDGSSWTAAAALPPPAEPSTDLRRRARVSRVRGKLLLFVPVEERGAIDCFEHEDGEWLPCGSVPVAEFTGLWAVNLSGVPTLVTAATESGAGETVSAFRLLGETSETAAPVWRRAELEFSDSPEQATGVRYQAAAGFNQHLALLAIDTKGRAYLRFARLGATPAEPTVAVADLLAQPQTLRRAHGLLQMALFVLLLAVLTSLFLLRRRGIVALPAGCAVAFTLQRLLSWLIDFLPFTVAFAIAFDVSWLGGLKALAQWGISANPDVLPEQWPAIFGWWGLSVLAHTTYMLIMELLTRRTAGKAITRICLLSETGLRPAAWQILLRNATRLLELLPQFWVFALLILLSHNRQRVGDVFARTIAIRLVARQPARTDDVTSGRSDKPASGSPQEGSSAPPDSDRRESPDAPPRETNDQEPSDESERRHDEPGPR
jgi:uncharacterized RDD family membrane protein YckC